MNASRSNPKVLVANLSISERNLAPGASPCFSIHASKRWAMPLACGMPPIPAGWSITRLLSVMANWPRRKNPSRGVVATQLGLPRPALRNADWVVREVFLARLISSSLISNGLRASNLRSVRMSVMICSCQFGKNRAGHSPARLGVFRGLCQQHDEHHSPERQQRVSNRVGDRVTEARNL